MFGSKFRAFSVSFAFGDILESTIMNYFMHFVVPENLCFQRYLH